MLLEPVDTVGTGATFKLNQCFPGSRYFALGALHGPVRLSSWRVDVSTVIKLRKVAKDAAMAAFASSRPGRPPTTADVAVDELRAENARLTEALKELAIELSLVRGKPRWA